MFWKRRKRANFEPNLLPYKVFTRQFDREVTAIDLWREVGAGKSLEEMGAALHARTPAWLRAVQRAMDFQARYRNGHDPGERPFFTLLIDHFGSMRGPKGVAAATTAEVVGDILVHERPLIDLLGFTTIAWRGGRSRQAWFDQKSPRHPGRLCDLPDIIYRDAVAANEGWSRYLPLLFEPEVLRENIDGEALLWARDRAMRSNPAAWVCLLISDGVPMDDSTVAANGGGKTDWHLARRLQSVVEDCNNDPRIRVGCLSLDYEARAPFQAVRPASVLSEAPLRAFDLLDDLIWGAASGELQKREPPSRKLPKQEELN